MHRFIRPLVAFLLVAGSSTLAQAQMPTATTAAASSLTTSSAVLNGTGTPAGQDATGWFRYDTTDPNTCNDSFGTRVPGTGGTDLGTGTTAVAYSITATGLVSGTTYYFCAIVSNASGTAFGAVLSFIIPGPPLSTTTLAATLVTSTSATINGSANPSGASTTGYFRYSATSPGSCSDSFGTRVPASGGTGLGSGASSVNYSQTLSSLAPGTTYYFCAIANNTYGTGLGSVLTFSTPAVAPVVTTNTESLLAGTTAQLNGSANPGGADTLAWFRYDTENPGSCNDAFGTAVPAMGGTDLGSGDSTVAFSQSLTGLTQATTYYFCAIASNSVGKVYGAVLTFTTLEPPTVDTYTATNLTNTSATLTGAAAPNGDTTTGWFEYAATNPGTCSDSFGSAAPTSGGASLGSGTTLVQYSEPITNLSPGTTYYFCAIASNPEGMSFGAIVSFTTLAPPTATTRAATSVTASTATLNGSANPDGATAQGLFEYSVNNPGSCTQNFGTQAPSTTIALGSAYTAASFSANLTGLTPSTTYYFCAIGENGYGSALASVLSFTTLAAAPTVTTTAATSLTGTTAVLNANANPGGADTTGWFRYALVSPGTCNNMFGTAAPTSGGTDLGSGIATVAYSQTITGLTAGTLYYYCALVSNSVNSAVGSVLTFTTPLPPTVTTIAASSITNTYAYLEGTVNPNNATATGWFRYSTTNPTTCTDSFGTRIPASGGYSLGSVSYAEGYDEEATGLSPGTTYYYCAIASNSEGTEFGAVVSFTTLAPPTVTTEAATSLTSSSATINGSAIPNGIDTQGWLRYSTTSPGTCSDSFGTRVPTYGSTDLSSGMAAVAYNESISGLSPITTYYVCAIASNSYGTEWGSVVPFTTPAAAPAVESNGASPVTGTTATLNGEADPGGADTTGWFRYDVNNPTTCTDSFGTRVPSAGGVDVGSGTSYAAFTEALTGLTANTTYYFCALGSNSVGSAVGAVQSFTTPLPPTVTTTAATSVTNTGATLNGSADPNNATTSGWFRYAATSPMTCNNLFGSLAPTSGTYNLGGGSGTGTYSEAITSLSAGTTYYYCAIASNSEGTSYGAVLSFTTASVPVVTTTAATSVTFSTANMNGSATPYGADTTGWFMYSTSNPGTCSNSFGTRVPSYSGTDLGTGITAVAYSQSLSGLIPSTTYYYCAIASNAYGTEWGSVVSFTTSATAPTMTTEAATNLTGTTAQLNGYGDPGGADTLAWFRYDVVSPGTCNDTFGTQAPTSGGTDLGSGSSAASYDETITALTSGTTYYFCAIGSNSVMTAYGSVLTFTTPVPPTVTTTAATNLTNTTAYLNGYADPNSGTTTGWFRYDTTNPTTCDDSFGTRVPASGGVGLGSGTGDSSYDEYVSGLTAGTTYYFCAIASNTAGTSFGTVLSFTTYSVPSVTTLAASSVTSGTAVLEGTVDPDGSSTYAWFFYSTASPGTCTASFGTETSETYMGTGTTSSPYGETIYNLLPNTTYYVCAEADNGYGNGWGTLVSFTTEAAIPTVSTSAPTSVTETTATLNGSANPNGADTTAWFMYATTNPTTCNNSFGTAVPAMGGTDLGAGVSYVAFSQSLTGLTAGTTYYVCALASNSVGTGVGSVVTFTTPLPPTVTTNNPSALSNTSATLNGTASPNNAATTGWFMYATTNPGTCNDSFGSMAPTSGGVSLGSTGTQSFSASITGLSPGTTYYYCAIASNTAGTGFGAVESFVTEAPPTVTTGTATSVTSSSVVLNGSGVANGADTTGWFEYSTTFPGNCSTSFGTRVPVNGGTDLGTGLMAVAFSQTISGLTPSTTYYFCALDSNAYGTALGTVSSFVSTATTPTVTTESASGLTGTTAQLNGAADPGGADTVGWFRYATASPGTCNDSFGTRAPTTSGTDLGSGNGTIAFDHEITGLTPGTTYYFCALGSNSTGSAVGSVLTVTTPLPPSATSLAATPITSTTATLNGYGNGNGYATTGWFRYDTSNPGTCNDSFGTRVPTTSGANLGTTGTSYSEALTALEPGTLYYFCAIVSTSVSEGYGSVLSFTTASTSPTVTTVAASGIAAASATLSGTGVPNGDDTTGWFRYSTTSPGTCTDSFGTRLPTSGGTDLGSGTSAVPWSQTVSGLTEGVTYYFCAIALNGIGTSVGSVLSFNTAAPVVTTQPATALSSTGATLNGSGNPNSTDTTAWFEYSTTNPTTCSTSFGTRVPSSGGTDLGSGSAAVAFSQALTGLSAATTYYYCAIASSTSGTGLGSVVSFTTAGPPTVVTSPVTLTDSADATLNGSANPNNADTSGWFRYATTSPGTCSDSFGTRVPVSGGTDLGAGASAVVYTQAISGLTPGTTYYACALASNTYGTSTGSVVTFTMAATAPTVSTIGGTPLTGTSAQLSGSANPGGADTTAWFQYDTSNPGTCDAVFGTMAPAPGKDTGAGDGSVTFTETITSLTPGTTYYFCAVASNSVGTTYGTIASFTTPEPPEVVTSTASAVTSTTATLNGSGNPYGVDTVGWFRYDVTNPGSCSDDFGTLAPPSGGTDLGTGASPASYSQAISGLSPLTAYFYCAIASSAAGEGYGEVLTFATGGAPAMATSAATTVSATAATLNGSGIANGADTTGWFRYSTTSPGSCNDSFGIRTPASGGTDLGAGPSGVPYTQSISGLTPGTTYYACALGSNAYGASSGAVVSFTTASAAPIVTTVDAIPLSGTTAQVDGSANPGGGDTTAWFRYDVSNPNGCNDTFGTAVPAGAGTDLGSGDTPVAFSQTLTRLVPGTTYYVCAIASNATSIAFGAILTFIAPLPPTVTTAPASSVAATTAILNGSANPNSAATTGWFRYDVTSPSTCDDTFGTRVPASGGTSLGAGSAAAVFSQTIGALSPETTYYFCALASNTGGLAVGTVQSFTTPAAPLVATTQATAVTSTTATLGGSATPNGADTTGWFRYDVTNPESCSDSFGTRTPASRGMDLGSGSSAVAWTQAITGLTPGTTYYFCALGSNAYGTATGDIVTFATPAAAPVVTTVDGNPLSGTSAELDGTANPGGADTTGWFRYDTSNPTSCNDAFGTRAPSSGGTDVGSGNSTQPFSQTISGLFPGMTYYLCAIASNSMGTSFGAVVTFTAPVGPTVQTLAASAVVDVSATLNGSANPAGAATNGWFRYDTTDPGTCDDSFGTEVPAGGTSLGAGNTSQPYSEPITGLTPGTTYYFCALASNVGGLATGSVLSFTTLAAPAVTTLAATVVTSTTATLNGSATPNGADATGSFEYSTTNPGTCSANFGTSAPASGGTDLGSGTSAVPWSNALTGLTPGTTYYFCALASNAYGTSTGTVLTFTTPPAQPVVTTVDGTPLSGTTAQLDGTANPNGGDTTGWFRYDMSNPGTCDDVFGTRAPASGGTDVGAGNSAVDFSQTISGLIPGTTYYVCAIASNAQGTSFGAVLQFTAPFAPTVATSAATSVVDVSATLNGSGDPNGTATTGWFRYSVTDPDTCNNSFGTVVPASGGASLGAGTTSQAYSEPITGLTPGATYYFCALASSSGGLATGSVLSFTTLAAPAVTTLAATVVTSSTASLNGSATPNGADATGWFRYDTTSPGTCSDSFGTRAPASSGTDLGAGNSAVPWTQAITGLAPGTTYYFCALAANAYGTATGDVLTFTTSAVAPVVTTVDGNPLSATSAELDGTANPGGAETLGWFRYDTSNPGTCDDGFGTRVPSSGGTDLGSGYSSVAFSETPSVLVPGATYYFCAIASNSVGTSFGAVLSFTTPVSPTVVTSAATSIADVSATLNGSANPNGLATTGWFRYAATDPGTCADSFGTRAPTTGGVSLGSGTVTGAYSQSVAGLTPGTTYYFCALASSSGGLATGAVLTFTTFASPGVTTSAASEVTFDSATLNGSVNPNGDATTGWFRYNVTNPGACNDSFGVRAPATGGAALGSGTVAVVSNQAISGLMPATTYYYCAIAANTYGTGLGAVMTFTTSGTVPTIVTDPAAGVTDVSAQLNGSGNPQGGDTTGWFRYDTTNPGTCNNTFGTQAPSSGGTDLGSGTTAVPWTQIVTGLTPNTTYYYCALGSNLYGMSTGAVDMFTTPPAAPLVTTVDGTPTSGTTAELDGTANPGGGETTGWFRYDTANPGTCDDVFGTRAPASGGTDLGSGTTPIAFSQTISGLVPGTTYYLCAIASNATGTSFGAVLSFIPPVAPMVVTSAASSVVDVSATLNGSANPNGAATTGWFRYDVTDPTTCDDSFGTRVPATGGASVGAGTVAQTFSEAITGLSPGTTYYFCALASSTGGLATGAVLSFTTFAAPGVVTSPATQVTSDSVTLNASVNPNGDATSGWFRYDVTNPGTCNDTFGILTPATGSAALGAGTSAVASSQAITGLAPATTYYYCALASNTFGVGLGGIVTFTTSGVAPVVTTDAATVVTATSAQLNGLANPGGADTAGWFRYDASSPGACDDTFGTRVPSAGGTDLGPGTSTVPWSEAITGLAPGTTYYYCALASNADGATTGSVITFTTPPAAPVVTTVNGTPLSGTTAQLDGSANSGGGDTSGWFRYDTSNPGTCDDVFGTRAPASGGTDLGSGTTAQPFSETVGALSPGTTYFLCAIASNASGTLFGAVLSFTTPIAPTVVTDAASAVADLSATLNGSANPNGEATTGWFRYAATNPGTCNDSFGTRMPATGGTSIAAGTTVVPYAQAISGLSPTTTYYFCALASSAGGLSVGEVLSFTTLAAPVVVTSPATQVGFNAALLNGSINPNGDTTTSWFRYDVTDPGTCSDTFGTRAPTMGGAAMGAGTTGIASLQAVSGLMPDTTYFYCAIASNSLGTGLGEILSFTTTATAPAVTTNAATGTTAVSVQLNGSANPDGADTTGWFRYDATNPGSCSDAFGTRSPATGGTDLGSGIAAAPWSQTVAGLTPGTTYYFCALGANAYGTSTGGVLTFTTPVTAPAVTTVDGMALSATTAELNGMGNPGGSDTTGWFRYATTSPGTCSDSFGTRAPATGGTDLGAGTSAEAFSQMVSALSPGTTYYLCAIASNATGVSFGAVVSFTTPAGSPTVSTDDASQLTSSTAALNGDGVPNGADTTAWFRYDTTNPTACSDSFGTRVPTSAGTDLGAGLTDTTFSQPIAGLMPATFYYYCAIASSSVATSFGTVLTFTTANATNPPAVTSEAATAITSTGATINGTVDPNFITTTAWFRYSATDPGTCDDAFGTRMPATGGTAVGAGGSAVAIAQTLTDLAPGATLYFCAIASNSVGTAFGAVLSFSTTAALPTVTTGMPTSVEGDAATLNGTANPNGADTTAWFRYDTTNPGTCDDSFGTRVPGTGGTDVGSGVTATPYSEMISSLSPNTTYYVCAIASNSVGTAFGDVVSITPGVLAPVVTTSPATDVVGTSATLAGTVNPSGSDSTAYFLYGTTQAETCTASFGERVPATGGVAVPSGTTAVPIAQAVSGLTANTIYYYCAAASNAGGATFGDVLSFMTQGGPPVVTTAAPTLGTSGAATLNGSANPNGSDTTAWFRYSSTNPGTCDDMFGVRLPASGGQDLGSGTAPMPFSQTVTALKPGIWYACAIASNTGGTAFGAVTPLVIPSANAKSGCGCSAGGLGGESLLWLVAFVSALIRARRPRAGTTAP